MSELQTAITNLQLKHSELVAAVKSYPGTVAGAANVAFGEASVEQRKIRDIARSLRNQIEDDGQSLILDWEHDVAVVNGEGKLLSEEVEFSRATGGGRFNAQGQYEWVEADVPRIDYDPVTGECLGLLVEEQGTNLFSQNHNIYISWPDRHVEVVGDSVVPEAFEIFCPGVDETPNGSVNGNVYGGGSSASGGIYHRFMIKQGNAKELRVQSANSVIINWTPFEGLENAASSTRQIDRIGEWFLITILVTYGGSGQGRYGLRLAVRDKVDEEKDLSLIMANYQVERMAGGNPIPSSYIPTQGATVTRAKDFVTRDLGSEYNQSEGTLTVTAKTNIGAVVARLGSLELIADTADTKAYTLSYTDGPASPVLELLPVGSGTISDVQYAPRATL